ncbi:nucleotidyltransferase domain-containing protein [Longimicrobium sp.]|uniref:nucleotidyltransferase domain-containing protein n=1 Tax=Longimicrobium sp. TaxID=2029185 RepID=UPI002E354F27|nr:nucleotidyltransferase domain-containing protein [Longimicrobium sp.]HEX6042209.1 nucleotidyltransferase domain-containing protein [Longimicrobium sp.]
MGRLVVFFAVHPGQRFHLRELMRRTGLPSASMQAELRRLTGLGALGREEEGGRAIFRADEAHPAWHAWTLLLRSCVHPPHVVREALVDANGIDCAFVFGSMARGDARHASDVDVLLIGDDDAQLRAGRVLSEVSFLIDREIDVLGYTRDEIAERIRSGNTFIQDVLDGPKVWMKGDPASLDLEVTA